MSVAIFVTAKVRKNIRITRLSTHISHFLTLTHDIIYKNMFIFSCQHRGKSLVLGVGCSLHSQRLR